MTGMAALWNTSAVDAVTASSVKSTETRKQFENNNLAAWYMSFCWLENYTIYNEGVCCDSNATLTQWRISGEWAYECNSPPIRNDRKVIARHS